MNHNDPDDDMARLADMLGDNNNQLVIREEDGEMWSAPVVEQPDGTRAVRLVTDDGDDVTIPWDHINDDACPDDEPAHQQIVEQLDDEPAPVGDAAPIKRARPEIVPWIRSRVGGAAVRAGLHIVKSPWFALRGIGTTVNTCHRWVTAADDADMHRQEIKAAGSISARRALRAAHGKRTFLRGIIAALPIIGVWGWVQVGQWGMVPAVTLTGAYVAAHIIGYRSITTHHAENQPAHPGVTAKGKRPPLSRPFVTEALALAKFEGADIKSAAPTKGGERLIIELAAGSTVSQLVKRHEELAGALGRPAECVVIEPKPDLSPRMFELYIAHRLLSDTKPPVWAWGKVKERSFFDMVPVGIDAQGNTVSAPLFETHGMIGGGTGMGKTYTARLLLMAAACDPYAKLVIHNMKGGPDYRGFAPVAHSLRAGTSKADLKALADDLAWVQAEIARRGRILETLPAKDVPEGKLTAKVARQHDMGPIIVLIDEPQRAFASSLGETIAALTEDIVRTARAVGITLRLVTQGTKEGAIPSGILDQLGHRFGHGVTTISDANLTLGSDAHGRGYRAVDIDTPGVAYVGAAGGRMVRTMIAKVDLPDVERIVTEAAALRKEAGTLTGMAAGHVPADTHDGGTRSFLADVLTVWPLDAEGEPERNAASADLAELLTAHDADEYADVDGAGISRRLSAAGVKVGPQRFSNNRPGARGVRHADVHAAHTGA